MSDTRRYGRYDAELFEMLFPEVFTLIQKIESNNPDITTLDIDDFSEDLLDVLAVVLSKNTTIKRVTLRLSGHKVIPVLDDKIFFSFLNLLQGNNTLVHLDLWFQPSPKSASQLLQVFVATNIRKLSFGNDSNANPDDLIGIGKSINLSYMTFLVKDIAEFIQNDLSITELHLNRIDNSEIRHGGGFSNPLEPFHIIKILSKNQTLRSLSIANDSIGLEALQTFIKLLQDNKTLTTVDLSDNPLTDESLALLVNLIKNNKNLRKIKLSNTQLTQITNLLEAFDASDITEINLSYNELTIDSRLALADFIKKTSKCVKLEIAEINLKEDDKQIIDAIAQNKSIRYLDLSYNYISGLSIAKIIKEKPTLTDLKIISATLSDESLGLIYKSLVDNFNLECLDDDYVMRAVTDPVSIATLAQLKKALETNMTLHKVTSIEKKSSYNSEEEQQLYQEMKLLLNANKIINECNIALSPLASNDDNFEAVSEIYSKAILKLTEMGDVAKPKLEFLYAQFGKKLVELSDPYAAWYYLHDNKYVTPQTFLRLAEHFYVMQPTNYLFVLLLLQHVDPSQSQRLLLNAYFKYKGQPEMFDPTVEKLFDREKIITLETLLIIARSVRDKLGNTESAENQDYQAHYYLLNHILSSNQVIDNNAIEILLNNPYVITELKDHPQIRTANIAIFEQLIVTGLVPQKIEVQNYNPKNLLQSLIHTKDPQDKIDIVTEFNKLKDATFATVTAECQAEIAAREIAAAEEAKILENPGLITIFQQALTMLDEEIPQSSNTPFFSWLTPVKEENTHNYDKSELSIKNIETKLQHMLQSYNQLRLTDDKMSRRLLTKIENIIDYLYNNLEPQPFKLKITDKKDIELVVHDGKIFSPKTKPKQWFH